MHVQAKTPDQIIRSEWDTFLGDWERKERLMDAGILGRITKEELDEGERPLVNGAQLQRFHTGAISQSNVRFLHAMKVLDEMIPGFWDKLSTSLDEAKVPSLPKAN